MHPIDIYRAWISGLTGGEAEEQDEQEQVDGLIKVLDCLLSLPASKELPEFDRYCLALSNARAGYAGISTLSDALVAVSWRLQQGTVAKQQGEALSSTKRSLLSILTRRPRHV